MDRWNGLPLLAGLTLLALSPACGGGGSDGPTDGGGTPPTPGPETAELYCDELYTTFAARWAECSKGALAWATHYIDKTRLCAEVVNAVNAGTATYDRTASGKCLAFFDAASCTDLRAIRDDVKYVADCRAAVVGKGTSGYPFTDCGSDVECASGRCELEGVCPGICYDGAAQGQSCYTDRDCAPGLYCFMGSPYVSTCQPHDDRPAEGETCTISTGCLPGLYCAGSTHPQMEGACAPQVTTGACEAALASTAPGYGCIGGTAQPLFGEGEPCASAPSNCGPGLYCDGSVCAQQALIGQACTATQGCVGGYCGPSTFVCIESPIAGCYSDWDCESKGVCRAGCQAFCY